MYIKDQKMEIFWKLVRTWEVIVDVNFFSGKIDIKVF